MPLNSKSGQRDEELVDSETRCLPSMRMAKMSRSMVNVVKSTSTENTNVQMGSASFHSGCNIIPHGKNSEARFLTAFIFKMPKSICTISASPYLFIYLLILLVTAKHHIQSDLRISNSLNLTPRLCRTKVEVSKSQQLTMIKYNNWHRFFRTQLYWNLGYSEETTQSVSVKAAPLISKFTCHGRRRQTK